MAHGNPRRILAWTGVGTALWLSHVNDRRLQQKYQDQALRQQRELWELNQRLTNPVAWNQYVRECNARDAHTRKVSIRVAAILVLVAGFAIAVYNLPAIPETPTAGVSHSHSRHAHHVHHTHGQGSTGGE